MDEEENLSPAIHAKSDATSRQTKKHASQTVVVPSRVSKEPSPSERLSGNSVAMEKGGVQVVKVEASPKPERDRINNLVQKEKKLEEAGVTRRKAYQVIADLLEAVVVRELRDSQGNVKYENVPDLDKRLKGAELAMKMFGDLIERREVEYSVEEGTLAKLKGLSVEQLKSRALEILAGKTSSSRLP